MAGRKTARPAVGPWSRLVGRQWLREQVEKWLAAEEGWTGVLVGPPGVGKSAFLRALHESHPDSVMVDIRRPLGTHRPEGFWAALLSQLDLEGKRVPEPAHEAARWAAEHLALGARKQRLVLVDSLDRGQELLDASGLAGLDHPLPGVRLLMATRACEELAGLERAGAHFFMLNQHDPRNLGDVETYLSDRIQEGRSLSLLSRLAGLAAGNFMVARAVSDAHQSRRFEHVDLKRAEVVLPVLDRSLGALWEEVARTAPGLEDDLARVACCLCEAGEPLPTASLADFLGMSASRVGRVLRALRPLLEECRGRYWLFHPALASLVARRFQRDLVGIHRGVVAYFREAFPSWEEMTDPYGWAYLGHHCDRLARTARRRDYSVLHWLGEGPFLRAKLNHTRSLRAVLDDLYRCLRAAMEEVDLPRIVYYGLLIPRLRAEEAARGLHELADLGELELAQERAFLMGDERAVFLGLLLLAWQSHLEGKSDFVEEFWGAAEQVPRPRLHEDDLLLVQAVLADLAGRDPDRALALLDREEDPLRAVSYALRLGQNEHHTTELRGQALELALRWTDRIEDPEDREQARRTLEREKRNLSKNGRPWELPGKDLAAIEGLLGELLSGGDGAKLFPKMMEQIGRLRWETRRVLAIGACAAALTRLADQAWACPSFLQLVQVVVQIGSPEERLKALGKVSHALARARKRAYTAEVTERLSAVAETLEELPLRSRALAMLGADLHLLHDFRGSNARLSESASLAFRIEQADTRAHSLMFLAGCVAETQNASRARDLAFHGLQAGQEPPAERVDHNTRCSLAVGVVSTGQEPTSHMLQTAAQAAGQAVEPRQRASALLALARGMHRLGESEWAGRLFEQALGAARTLAPGATQAVALCELASHCAEVGESARAEKVLGEALETLQKEGRPGARAEGHLAAAVALRDAGNEHGERYQTEQALRCLDGLISPDLALSSALQLIPRLKQVYAERVRTLVWRAHEAIGLVQGQAREEVLLAVLRAELGLGNRETAEDLMSQLVRTDYRCRALMEMARALIQEHPGDALDCLRRIQLRSERMLAVRQCVVDLSSEMRPSRQRQVRDTMVELTLLAVEEEETADLVLSRWTYYRPNLGALVETMRRMGWLPEDSSPVGAGTVQLRGR